MSRRRITVTDHAVLRYLERVQGMDIRAVRREIADRCDVAADHPGVTAVLSSGHRFILRGGAIVTVTGLHPHKFVRRRKSR